MLVVYGYEDLDVAVVRGNDRRVTRSIAQWAALQADESGNPLFAGIRYLSRLNNAWECWAVFDDTPLEVIDAHPVLAEMPELCRVADTYGLKVH